MLNDVEAGYVCYSCYEVFDDEQRPGYERQCDECHEEEEVYSNDRD